MSIQDIFGARKPAPAHVERETLAELRDDPFDITGDTAYGMVAIRGMAGDMASQAPGGRDTLLNNLCLRAGNLIRDGKLTRETAEMHLRDAAMSQMDASFDAHQIEEKLSRAITEGMNNDHQINYGLPPGEQDWALPEKPAGDSTMTPEEQAERAHQWLVNRELAQLRARDEAKRLFDAEKASRDFREPPSVFTLADELQIPDEPVQYAIAELLPVGANALLAAQYKTGKTTLINNYARCFADGKPFLGRYDVNPAGGRLAIYNYELSRDMNRRWLRELAIANPDRIVVLNLRGFRMPLNSPVVEEWIVRWLAEREVTAWIPDPFARASVGTEENSNTEVGVWLDTLDVIKERADVRDLILPTHTGRGEQEAGQERSRGATRLDDWADVRWILTKDPESDVRFFRATGRDVEVPEEKLTFHEADRSLVIGGGDRKWEAKRHLEQAVLDFVNANPGAGVKAIQMGVTGRNEAIDAARHSLVARHKVRVEDAGRGGYSHYANAIDA